MHVPQDSMWRKILKIFWFSGWTKQGHRICKRILAAARQGVRARTFTWHAGREAKTRNHTMASAFAQRKSTRVAEKIGKWNNLTSGNTKLLEQIFTSFAKFFWDGKCFSKLLEMLLHAFFFWFWHYSTFVCIWQTLSNHRITRFKRFVSRFIGKLYN